MEWWSQQKPNSMFIISFFFLIPISDTSLIFWTTTLLLLFLFLFIFWSLWEKINDYYWTKATSKVEWLWSIRQLNCKRVKRARGKRVNSARALRVIYQFTPTWLRWGMRQLIVETWPFLKTTVGWNEVK